MIRDDQKALEYLMSKVAFFQEKITTPSLEALLALKDQLAIPNDQWALIRKTFNLKNEGKLYQIEQLHHVMNETLSIHLTPGGRGWEIVSISILINIKENLLLLTTYVI